jgi:hypothetical protein
MCNIQCILTVLLCIFIEGGEFHFHIREGAPFRSAYSAGMQKENLFEDFLIPLDKSTKFYSTVRML